MGSGKLVIGWGRGLGSMRASLRQARDGVHRALRSSGFGFLASIIAATRDIARLRKHAGKDAMSKLERHCPLLGSMPTWGACPKGLGGAHGTSRITYAAACQSPQPVHSGYSLGVQVFGNISLGRGLGVGDADADAVMRYVGFSVW